MYPWRGSQSSQVPRPPLSDLAFRGNLALARYLYGDSGRKADRGASKSQTATSPLKSDGALPHKEGYFQGMRRPYDEWAKLAAEGHGSHGVEFSAVRRPMRRTRNAPPSEVAGMHISSR